jgi:hypothetical protein
MHPFVLPMNYYQPPDHVVQLHHAGLVASPPQVGHGHHAHA